ncbi:MAG: HD domain-containing protein [Acidimicrobiia bacterium]
MTTTHPATSSTTSASTGSHTPAATAPTFTRMDASTAAQWGVIARATIDNQPRVADRVLEMLRALAGITDGFAVDQLTHSLQTATLAERAGADDEVVVASLCHDIGKFVSVANHPRIAAEILRPYVREEVRWMIEVHQDFQGKHYFHHLGGDPEARERHRDHEWFELARSFADDWDQIAFDPAYDTLPLEHFEDRVREVFKKGRLV